MKNKISLFLKKDVLTIKQMEKFLYKEDVKKAKESVNNKIPLLNNPIKHFSEINLAKKHIKTRLPKNPQLKNKLIVSWICFGVLAGLLIPNIYQMITTKVDNRPISSFPIDNLFPNQDVPKDENGDFIEKPVNYKELAEAFLILEKKLISDAQRFGMEFSSISSILGIYEHKTLDENTGTKSIIEILFLSNNKINSLQYMNFNKTNIDFSLNETNNIMEFFNFMPSCYPLNCYTQEEIKNALIEKIDEAYYISDPFEFTYHSNLREYHIVAYKKDGSYTVFKTDKNYLDNHNIEPLNALMDYLNGKKVDFTFTTDIGISNFNPVTEACDKAINFIIENPELLLLEQVANIKDYDLDTDSLEH